MAVTRNELALAREWLLCNEGDGDEVLACTKAADFLQAEIDRRDVRSIARETGMTLAQVRASFVRGS